MNQSSFIFFTLCILLSSAHSSPMQPKLTQEQRIATVLHNARVQLDPAHNLEKKLYQNEGNYSFTIEDIRKQWARDFETNPWLAGMLHATIRKVDNIPLGSEFAQLQFNDTHTLIQTVCSDSLIDDERAQLYTKDGVELHWPSIAFTREEKPTVLDAKTVKDLYGIKSDFLWKVINAQKSPDRLVVRYQLSKILHQATIYDIKPYNNFKDYAQNRIPLAQILLCQAVGLAHWRHEPITLQKHEVKVLNGFPPQFEAVKNYIQKHVIMPQKKSPLTFKQRPAPLKKITVLQ